MKKMDSTLVSIIIPVYNAEKYIEETLNSILDVKSSEIEVIAVDDGSSDSSLAILQEYEKKDSRIKVIHKENAGASSARNMGLSFASGEYVYFEDADDPVISESLGYGIELCKLKKYDWIVFDHERDKKEKTHSDNNREFFGDDLWLFEKLYTTFDWNPVWGKFFRRKVIVDNSLTFNESIIYGEDLLFNLRFSEAFKTGLNIEKEILMYRDTPQSIMNTFKYQRLSDTATIIGEKCSFLEKKRIEKKYLNYAFDTMREGLRNDVEQAFLKGDFQKMDKIKEFISDHRIESIMKQWYDQTRSQGKTDESLSVKIWYYAIYKKNIMLVNIILSMYFMLHRNRWK